MTKDKLITVILAFVMVFVMKPVWAAFTTEPWPQKPQVGQLNCDESENGIFNEAWLNDFNDRYSTQFTIDKGERTISLEGNGLWRLTHYCNPDGTAWKVSLWIKYSPTEVNPDGPYILTFVNGMKESIGFYHTLPQDGKTILGTKGRLYGAIHTREGYSIIIVGGPGTPLKENLEIEQSPLFVEPSHNQNEPQQVPKGQFS